MLVSETLVSQRQPFLRLTHSSILGGPLLSSDGTIIGVVSFGNPECGIEGFPTVLARTSAAVDFIKRGICVLSEYPPDYCEDFTPAPTPSPPPPPSNDLCENAVALELGLFSGSTRGATFDDVGLCGTINSGPGVWVSVVGKSFKVFWRRITIFVISRPQERVVSSGLTRAASSRASTQH